MFSRFKECVDVRTDGRRDRQLLSRIPRLYTEKQCKLKRLSVAMNGMLYQLGHRHVSVQTAIRRR